MTDASRTIYQERPDSATQAQDARARAWFFVFECFHRHNGQEGGSATAPAPEVDRRDNYKNPANEERSQGDLGQNAILDAEGAS
jgi:hypothetical protein